MLSVQELTNKNKIIPVVKINDINQAAPLARALYEGGISSIEITFRTECALEAIEETVKNIPDMLVGAGTVTTKTQAEAAIKAGAKFIVSPGFSEQVAITCKEMDTLYLPGCITPTEIMNAMEYGIETVKFFPAENNGGVKAIQALSGPFKNITFIPTGGIHAGNIKDYLRNPKIVACGGSWLVNDIWLKEKNFSAIKEKAKEAIELVREANK